MKPLATLAQAMESQVMVELKGNRGYRGVLDGYDPHMNLVLKNAEEIILRLFSYNSRVRKKYLDAMEQTDWAEIEKNRGYRGVLDGYDPHMNLVLKNAEELVNNEVVRKLEITIVRGEGK